MLHNNPDEELVCQCENIKSQDEMWLFQSCELGVHQRGRRRRYPRWRRSRSLFVVCVAGGKALGLLWGGLLVAFAPRMVLRMVARLIVFADQGLLLVMALQMDLEIMTLPCAFRVVAALEGVVWMDQREESLPTVEEERVSALNQKSAVLQGYSEMMFLTMNSVCYPPRTFQQPVVSLLLVIPSARQLSKHHSPWPFSPGTSHSPSSYLPGYSQSMQLTRLPALVVLVLAAVIVKDRQAEDFAVRTE